MGITKQYFKGKQENSMDPILIFQIFISSNTELSMGRVPVPSERFVNQSRLPKTAALD